MQSIEVFLEIIFPRTLEMILCANRDIDMVLPYGAFWLNHSVAIDVSGWRHLCTGAESRCFFYNSHCAVWGLGRKEESPLLYIIVYWNSVAWVFAYMQASKQAMGDRGRDRDWALWLGDGKWLVCHFCSLSLWQWRNVSRTSIISSSNWSTLARSALARRYLHLYLYTYIHAERERDARGQTSTSAQTSPRHRINQIARPPPHAPSLTQISFSHSQRLHAAVVSLTLALNRLNKLTPHCVAFIYK